MKIAIVAPSAVPFTIGGAENLWWGLLRAINQNTPHQADLIKLPTPENDFWSLIDSYRSFSNLVLTHFDMVISTKYPAWMVSHPNHTCYLQHRLRGLYDMYHFTGKPMTCESSDPSILELLDFMRSNRGRRESLTEFFGMIENLRDGLDAADVALAFPGPFVRSVVHFLDGIGLSSGQVCRFAAISRNVAGRQGYFPSAAKVDVIYHPSNLSYFHRGKMEYLFTASRLDGPKRVRLLIEAMKHVESPVELKIGGTGPEERELRDLAKSDPRVHFLGFVNDSQLIDLYADALAVLFVPYDEDYGLITIEAMMSGKPVITTTDSGGPNEFVKNGETGFSVSPDPKALAETIDHLWGSKDKAFAMGLNAQRSVVNITWDNVVSRLLGPSKQTSRSGSAERRKKISVAVTFPIFPPRGGGQSRIFHFYRQIAHRFEVELVTFSNSGEQPFRAEIAPGLREIRTPKSLEHQNGEWEIEKKVGVPVGDVMMPRLYRLTPDYLDALKVSTADADFVVACHPYLFPAIREVCDKPLWYEAQDVEIDLKKQILPDNSAGHDLLETTENVERECCEKSMLIMVCSGADGEKLQRLYHIGMTKIIEVPNGVDLETVHYVPQRLRNATKKRLGMERNFTALFIGSWHGPNLDAVRNIFRFAEELPDIDFLVVGSACLAFQKETRPRNVGFMGVVDDETKDVILGVVDVALNPMESGSGTNLKMLDYCAAGVPVISTPHGARGLALEHGEHIYMVTLDQFSGAIRTLRQQQDEVGRRVERAKNLVSSQYDWAAITRNFIDEVEKRITLW